MLTTEDWVTWCSLTLNPACLRKCPSLETISWKRSCCQFTWFARTGTKVSLLASLETQMIPEVLQKLFSFLTQMVELWPDPFCWQRQPAEWHRVIAPAERALWSDRQPQSPPQTRLGWRPQRGLPRRPREEKHRRKDRKISASSDWCSKAVTHALSWVFGVWSFAGSLVETWFFW